MFCKICYEIKKTLFLKFQDLEIIFHQRFPKNRGQVFDESERYNKKRKHKEHEQNTFCKS